MLKCGQKNNKNYTFGLTNKQIKEAEVVCTLVCPKCGKKLNKCMNFCSGCGEKLN